MRGGKNNRLPVPRPFWQTWKRAGFEQSTHCNRAFARIFKMTNQPYAIALAAWTVDHAVLSQIRFTVFVQEQGVPQELETDVADADPSKVVHVAAHNAAGELIGTARMLLEQPMPRIGRMAVLRDWRGSGVGKAMLEFLCAHAKQLGYQQIRLNSQTHATPFYYKQGFLSYGTEFAEAGIPHLEMRRAL